MGSILNHHTSHSLADKHLRRITRTFLLIIKTRQHTTTMESVKQAANYVSESVKGTGATASKEANKDVAKDNDAGVGTRAQAAKDAVSDKMDETSHNTKADAHKEYAKA